MSETLDTNILVYASTPDSPYQAQARGLLEQFARGPTLRYLLWPTIMGYLRIMTNPRVVSQPFTPNDALANIDRLVDRPHIMTVGESDGFWRIYERVADDVSPRGNLVSDAHLVALMLQHGISTIWSHDRDFRKFNGITVRDPFK